MCTVPGSLVITPGATFSVKVTGDGQKTDFSFRGVVAP
jgi:hypothetical protein